MASSRTIPLATLGFAVGVGYYLWKAKVAQDDVPSGGAAASAPASGSSPAPAGPGAAPVPEGRFRGANRDTTSGGGTRG